MNIIDAIDNQLAIRNPSNIFLKKADDLDLQAKNIPFLSNIPENALANLMGKAKTLSYTKKATIGSAYIGNRANSLLIIFSGKVRVVSRHDGNNKFAMIHVREPQSGVGKIALVTEEMRSSSLITLETTVFAAILKCDFVNWLIHYPDVDFALLSVLTEKLS